MLGNKQIFTIVLLLIVISILPARADYRENSKAIKASGGEQHTLILTADNSAWACGPNGGQVPAGTYSGVLGIGSDDWMLKQKTLVRVHGPNDLNYLEDINDIDAGWKHSLALDVNGCVWSWGWNSWGQLGVDDDQYRTTPVQVFRGEQADDPCEPSDYLARIVDISAGRSGEHSLAVDANGYAYAWGYNEYGQCGNDESGNSKLTPVHVHQGQQLDDPNDSTDRLKHIIAVSAGEWHSMALEAYDPCDPNWGRVYTWGDNAFGINRSGRGVLGDGTDVLERTTPVCVRRGEQDYNEPGQIYLKHIVAISAGWDHSMALEKYDIYDPFLGDFDPNHKGRVYSWGNNESTPYSPDGGRLGDGSTTSSSTPVVVLRGEQLPEDPCNQDPNLTRIVAVSAGEGHSMALDVNGYVYTWGDNKYGQLGNGCDDPCATPVRVVGPDRNRNGIHDANEGYLENIVAISAGYWHSLAIDADGTIWTWGKGSAGQLGLGITIDYNTPHRIPVVYNITQETFHFTIQSAIDDANDAGDTLEASPGTYFEDVDFLTKTIRLRSAEPNNADVVEDTVIQGSDSSGPAVKFTANLNSILTGFTIAAEGYDDSGIKCDSSSPTISNCLITDNAGYGVDCDQSAVRITNCIIRNNGDDGINGSACDVIVRNCIITNNSGEGICNIGSSSASITNSIISGNNDHGISSSTETEIEIKNNWIYGNGADDNGDGIHIYTAYPVDAVIRNNTVVDNSHYGIHADYATDISVSNCIIWDNGNDPNNDNLHAADYGTFDVTFSCLQGSYAGTGGNIDSDPSFYDDVNDDYHLTWDSNCVDTGDPGFEAEPNETDIDGEPRVMDGDANDTVIVDMGADEFYHSAADYSGDGLVNFIDYAMLTSYWQDAGVDYNDVFLHGDVNSVGLEEFCDQWLWEAGWLTGPMPLKAGRSAEGLSLQVAPYELSAAEEKPVIAEPVDVEKLLDWLAQIWLDPETQKVIDAEAWLKLYESVKAQQ